MKYFGTIAIILCAVLSPASGQIVIDWTEVPQDVGIEFVHNGAENVTINLGVSGGPQIWVLTTQPMGSQYTRALIVPRASTPFGDSFPNSNLVLQITEGSDTAYAYGQIAQAFGCNLGLGAVSPITTFFRFEPTDSYPLPMVYGASRQYHYGYTLELSAIMDLRTDSYGFEAVDAYGSVIIPYDTFGCLRMCSFDTTISTLSVGGFPVSVDTATHIIYDFLAENYGLIAHVLSNEGETNPNYTDAAFLERLMDYSTGIQELKNTVVYDFSCQPNPFSNTTDIRCQITDNSDLGGINEVALRIYDTSGRSVRNFGQISVIGHQLSVDWDGTDQANRQLGSGVYFVRLAVDGHHYSKKLLLVR